jgi:hypothetical protein
MVGRIEQYDIKNYRFDLFIEGNLGGFWVSFPAESWDALMKIFKIRAPPFGAYDDKAVKKALIGKKIEVILAG